MCRYVYPPDMRTTFITWEHMDIYLVSITIIYYECMVVLSRELLIYSVGVLCSFLDSFQKGNTIHELTVSLTVL